MSSRFFLAFATVHWVHCRLITHGVTFLWAMILSGVLLIMVVVDIQCRATLLYKNILRYRICVIWEELCNTEFAMLRQHTIRIWIMKYKGVYKRKKNIPMQLKGVVKSTLWISKWTTTLITLSKYETLHKRQQRELTMEYCNAKKNTRHKGYFYY